MFGYVRPDVPELTIRQFERYRSLYCGLCRAMGDRYGAASRLVLNYDLVFLAMLLWKEDEPSEYCFRRCVPSCGRRRCVSRASEPVQIAAGYSVILAYWKARDGVSDSSFFKGVPSRATELLLRGAYKKASADYPDYASEVEGRLAELAKLEKANETSLDRAADCFAGILSAAARTEPDDTRRRILEQLLYHVGRTIYIADAVDDLMEDSRTGSYNPVAARFSITDGRLTEDARESVRATLEASWGFITTSFALLPATYWSDTLENIVALGIPAMTKSVLAGEWNRKRKLPAHGGGLPQIGEDR